MRNEISKNLYDLSLKLGISPIYGATFIMLIISLITIRDIRRWDKLSIYQKAFDIAGWCGAILLIISSIIYSIKIYIFKSI